MFAEDMTWKCLICRDNNGTSCKQCVSIQVKYECGPYKNNIIAYHPYRQKQLKISVGLEEMFKLYILIHGCVNSVGILVQFEKKLKTTY